VRGRPLQQNKKTRESAMERNRTLFAADAVDHGPGVRADARHLAQPAGRWSTSRYAQLRPLTVHYKSLGHGGDGKVFVPRLDV